MNRQIARHNRVARSSRPPRVPPPQWNCDWIPSVAEPYLRGYAPQFESGDALIGYRFLAQTATAPSSTKRKARANASKAESAGFFVGYLLDATKMPSLKAAPPEFLIFCFIEPVGGRAHQGLVSQTESLMRRTAEYIRWLTHHPPRFELLADDHAALVRHIPISEWPAGRIDHYAHNFTIETLAWLVRSALVRRLPEEIAAPGPVPAARAAHK